MLQFVNRTGKYYSNDFTAMLDEKYGDIYGEMQDIEKKLLFDLAN